MGSTINSWNVKKADGTIYGSVDSDTVRRWITEKRISKDDYVLPEGYKNWYPVRSIPEFADMFGPLSSPETKPQEKKKSSPVGKIISILVLIVLGFVSYRFLSNMRKNRVPGSTVSFEKTTEARKNQGVLAKKQMLPEEYRGKKVIGAIVVDGKADDWADIPVLIQDAVGDFTLARISPHQCDLKNLKAAADSDYIYFLIEMAEGWAEIFRENQSTGALGWLSIDIDNDKNTGYDGGVIVVNMEGEERREIREENLDRGCEYSIYITTGFSQEFSREGKAETEAVPIVDASCSYWDAEGLKWESMQEKQPIVCDFDGPYIELGVSQEFINLQQGNKIAIIFEEQSAVRNEEYNVVRNVILPFLHSQ